METPDDIVKTVTRLVSLPEIFLRLQELVDNPDASLKDFSAIVKKDVALATKVLSIANSSFYGFSTPVDTIGRAVNIIGIAQLHDLVLATSVMGSFKGIPPDLMNMSTYWRSSTMCGLIAKALAEQCRILDTERMFLQGLLHDLGHLVLYLVKPMICREVLEAARKENEPVYLVERRRLGYDYGEVGAALMRAWKLPIGLQETAAFHLEPSKAVEFPLAAAIVHLAWHRNLTDELGTPLQLPALGPQIWSLTGLREQDIDAVMPKVHESLQDTLRLFFPIERSPLGAR